MVLYSGVGMGCHIVQAFVYLLPPLLYRCGLLPRNFAECNDDDKVYCLIIIQEIQQPAASVSFQLRQVACTNLLGEDSVLLFL